MPAPLRHLHRKRLGNHPAGPTRAVRNESSINEVGCRRSCTGSDPTGLVGAVGGGPRHGTPWSATCRNSAESITLRSGLDWVPGG